MKRALQILGGLAVVALLAAASRPASDLALFIRLNGQPTRWIMVDGGASGMYGSGQQCMPVAAGDVFKITPSAAVNLCAPSPAGITYPGGIAVGVWDGGCTATAADVNAGDYVGANVEHYIVGNDAVFLCQVPVTGSVNTPVFKMQ